MEFIYLLIIFGLSLLFMVLFVLCSFLKFQGAIGFASVQMPVRFLRASVSN